MISSCSCLVGCPQFLHREAFPGDGSRTSCRTGVEASLLGTGAVNQPPVRGYMHVRTKIYNLKKVYRIFTPLTLERS